MSVSVFRSTHKQRPKPQQHVAIWRNKKPAPYQNNVAAAIVSFLMENKYCNRADIYKTIENRWGLHVEMKRHYAKGGVGSYTWLPRRGCIRLQVGASRIDSKNYCYRYAPVVEIYDTWNTL